MEAGLPLSRNPRRVRHLVPTAWSPQEVDRLRRLLCHPPRQLCSSFYRKHPILVFVGGLVRGLPIGDWLSLIIYLNVSYTFITDTQEVSDMDPSNLLRRPQRRLVLLHPFSD